MSTGALSRRLDRLHRLGGGIDLAATLSAMRQRVRAWHDAGNAGPMPPDPLEPPPPSGARRYDRELWRKIAHGRARVIFLMSGEFDELRAAYAMSDADLWRTITQRERAARLTAGGP